MGPDDYMLFIDLEDFLALMLALHVMQMRAILESGFKALDTDGDGYIVGQEIAESFKKEGIELSDEQVKEVLARSDTDGDGKISFDEFVAAVPQVSPHSLRIRIMTSNNQIVATLIYIWNIHTKKKKKKKKKKVLALIPLL